MSKQYARSLPFEQGVSMVDILFAEALRNMVEGFAGMTGQSNPEATTTPAYKQCP